jgi:hypothetical protein
MRSNPPPATDVDAVIEAHERSCIGSPWAVSIPLRLTRFVATGAADDDHARTIPAPADHSPVAESASTWTRIQRARARAPRDPFYGVGARCVSDHPG